MYVLGKLNMICMHAHHDLFEVLYSYGMHHRMLKSIKAVNSQENFQHYVYFTLLSRY